MSKIEEILGKKAGKTACIAPDLIVITNGFSHEVTEMVTHVKYPDKVVIVYDQNVPAGLPEESKIFKEIYQLSTKYGIEFKQAKGIATKWLLEEKRINSGNVVLAGSRHVSAVGAVGALGVGVSHTEMARILESGEYQLIVPKTKVVKVEGKLKENVGIIDAALWFLRNAQDIKGQAIEFIAPELSSHEKETLCEMATDTGAFSAFIVDEGVEDISFDLGCVEPMLRLPCNELFDQKNAGFALANSLNMNKINAGQIGGINGGDIDDLRKVSEMIKGHKLKRGFRLSINPASSKVYLKALEEGLITKFIDYNAQINAAGDHDIVPQGAGAIGHGETLLTTGLYTYSGAMGCTDSTIYTASVETIIKASFE